MPAKQTPARTTGNIPNVKMRFVDGAVAGPVVVTGIKKSDRIMQVLNQTDRTDPTAEFTVTADNTISNVGGTSTAAKVLLVIWAVTPKGAA